MTSSLSALSRSSHLLGEIRRPVVEELDQVSERIRTILQTDIPLIREVHLHLLGMQGKLFRPTLLLLTSRVEGARPAQAPILGAALELIHVATLIHDDAIDGTAFRRGVPTLHARWDHRLSVIAGDFLYARGLSEIVGLGHPRVVEMMVETTHAMARGEMEQLAYARSLRLDEQGYCRLIQLKTANLIAAACEMGALVGTPAWAERMREFGLWLGTAFQITDDIMDYQGDASLMGKPVGTDIREGKATLPLIHAHARASPAERGRLEEIFGAPEVSEEEVREVAELVARHGGLEYATARAAQFAEAARALLPGLTPSPIRETLSLACDYVVERDR